MAISTSNRVRAWEVSPEWLKEEKERREEELSNLAPWWVECLCRLFGV